MLLMSDEFYPVSVIFAKPIVHRNWKAIIISWNWTANSLAEIVSLLLKKVITLEGCF